MGKLASIQDAENWAQQLRLGGQTLPSLFYVAAASFCIRNRISPLQGVTDSTFIGH